jgi:uncharacterized membrane protein YfcA
VTAFELVVVGVAVFFAAFTQAVAGFGFGLMAVPLMTLAIQPKIAVVVSTLLGISLTTWQAWHLRADADYKIARRLILSAYCGMPIGLWVFITVSNNTLRLILGIAVVIAVILLAFRMNLHHVGPGLDIGAGFLSGILNTSLSTNGPPLAFALQARQLDAVRFRATINTVFAFSNVVGLSLFLAAGRVTRHGLLAAAVALPSLFLGQAAGIPIRRHVSGERFRVLVLLLLVGTAVSAIIGALT